MVQENLEGRGLLKEAKMRRKERVKLNLTFSTVILHLKERIKINLLLEGLSMAMDLKTTLPPASSVIWRRGK